MYDATVVGRVERYRKDHLVVDLGDLKLVERELDRLGVSYLEPDEDHEDDRLGLALLELPQLAREKDELLRCARLTDGQPDSALADQVDQAIERVARDREERGLAPDLPELDQLLCVLRARFAYRYDGWTPTVGKNRGVELAKGTPHLGGGLPTPHLGGGAVGDPQPVDPPAAFTLDGYELAQLAPIGRGIQIAVLDTALWQHPFLLGRYVAPPGATISAAAAGTTPWVTEGHATFASGLILQRAPGAQVELHPVLDDQAIGDTWTAARKLAEVAASGVHIINLSWCCYTDDRQPPLVLARAVERLGPEVAVVAAAGNHARSFPEDELLGPQTPSWPAAFDRVIAVGASLDGDQAWFSPRAPWVDLLAPGVEVKSTYLTGEARTLHMAGQEVVEELLPKPFDTGFAKWSGTSFATAAVSGQLAADASGAGGVPHALERLLNLPEEQQAGSDIRPFTLQDLER